MLQPGRSASSGTYRFGFNGMENDNKKGGLGEHVDFGARGLNTWTGRFYGIDPLWAWNPKWGWWDAIRRYNGGGNKNYKTEVREIYESMSPAKPENY